MAIAVIFRLRRSLYATSWAEIWVFNICAKGRGHTGLWLAIQSMYLDDFGTELPEKQFEMVKNSEHISAYTSTASYSSRGVTDGIYFTNFMSWDLSHRSYVTGPRPADLCDGNYVTGTMSRNLCHGTYMMGAISDVTPSPSPSLSLRYSLQFAKGSFTNDVIRFLDFSDPHPPLRH